MSSHGDGGSGGAQASRAAATSSGTTDTQPTGRSASGSGGNPGAAIRSSLQAHAIKSYGSGGDGGGGVGHGAATSSSQTGRSANTVGGDSGGGSSSRAASVISTSEVDQALSRAGLVAVLNVCVTLYKFVNVELHSQGWYAVRVRVIPGPDAVCSTDMVVQSPQASGAVGTASSFQPIIGSLGGDGAQAVKGAAVSNRPPGGYADGAVMASRRQGWLVEESGCSFRSSVFRIRYCYEEVKLQTAVLCRIFVNNLRALSTLSVTLEFELMFQEANLENPGFIPDEFHLRSVARETVTLTGLAGGLAEYYGCTFSDEHFGLCSTGLFGGLAGFVTRDMMGSPSHRAVSSSWLCHLVGDSRREAGHSYRSEPSATANGLATGSGVPRPASVPDSSSSSLAQPSGAAFPVTASGRVAFVHDSIDFSDQELRKKVIRLLHHVVEAPSLKQGMPQIPSEAERLERLAAVYELLVEGHRRSRDRLGSFLRQVPPECYAPQNLDVLRALLASAVAASASAPGPAAAAAAVAAAAASANHQNILRGATPRASAAAPLARLSHGHGSGGGAAPAAAAATSTASAASATAAGTSSGGADGAAAAGHHVVPTVAAFISLLHHTPTTAAALQQLDGVLVGLSIDSRTDWAVLSWVLRTLPRELMRHLKLRWETAQPDMVLPFIVWDSTPSRDAIAAKAAAHRQKLRTPRFRMPAVQPGSLWGSPGDQPVLVVDDSQGIKWLAECDSFFGEGFRVRDESHVAIFVHGFQGAATDLCLVKAHLMLMYPYLECFSSKTNEGNTHDSLQEMGKRLAIEMAEFLAPFARSTRRPLRKITLVGHSIGNLILRAALTQPEFAPYKSLLWLYISVCGPHLGFLYGTNAVVDTGLLLLKSIGKGKCLHQLTFSDATQLTECYLYRLAHECPLSVFKLAVVVSSPQDRYVPYHSSAITTCPQAERDSRRGRCYNEMLRALTAGVGGGTHLFRLAVDFSLRAKSFSFSKLVGRTAHIEFIESQLYVGLMMWGLVHRYTMLAPSPHSWL
ncbi:hypothetical protein Vafri_18075 [Volvox africanus]|uniref:DUF676 domain-containing protein n=1 Tax=Volvox africanus TaxID=51714 RepID=A0A8J4FAU0_9CHLO|nr:hypothetical protein Vafri_18075 [Volvox africanus]